MVAPGAGKRWPGGDPGSGDHQSDRGVDRLWPGRL